MEYPSLSPTQPPVKTYWNLMSVKKSPMIIHYIPFCATFFPIVTTIYPIISQKIFDGFIELEDGTIYRKALYLMVKTMVSCRFSLKPIQWWLLNHPINTNPQKKPWNLNILVEKSTIFYCSGNVSKPTSSRNIEGTAGSMLVYWRVTS